MTITRVLHLVGSPTDHFHLELSELYAKGCIEAVADPARYEVVVAHISPGDIWRFPKSLDSAHIAAAEAIDMTNALGMVCNLEIDCALPQMFCKRGMNDYRALLDLLCIPFIGNRAFQMSIGADKAKARAIVSSAGVRVPNAELLRKNEQPSLALPLIIKPNGSDNSNGLSLVRSKAEMSVALETARAHNNDILAEAYIDLGREVRCGVIDIGGALICLPLEEYAVSVDHPIRTEADKLVKGRDGVLKLGAKSPDKSWIVGQSDPITQVIHEAALKSYVALGCRHYGLFDFRIDSENNPWFLEAGLYCSFSTESVICAMANAAGISLTEFFGDCVTSAVQDFKKLSEI